MQLKHITFLALSSLAVAVPPGSPAPPSAQLDSRGVANPYYPAIPPSVLYSRKSRRQTPAVTGGQPIPFDNQFRNGQQDISDLIRKVTANSQDIAALKDQDAQHSADIAKLQADFLVLQQRLDSIIALIDILRPLADPEIVASVVESTMSVD